MSNCFSWTPHVLQLTVHSTVYTHTHYIFSLVINFLSTLMTRSMFKPEEFCTVQGYLFNTHVHFEQKKK